MRLEIDGEYSGIKFSASHFIPGHAKCGRLHGHVYIVRLALHGEKDEQGMVMDFIVLKKALRQLSEELDHHVILPGNSDRMIISVAEEVQVETSGKRYVFPAEDVIILDIDQSSAEEIAEYFLRRLIEEVEFPMNVHRIEVGIDEERGQTAWACQEWVRD